MTCPNNKLLRGAAGRGMAVMCRYPLPLSGRGCITVLRSLILLALPRLHVAPRNPAEMVPATHTFTASCSPRSLRMANCSTSGHISTAQHTAQHSTARHSRYTKGGHKLECVTEWQQQLLQCHKQNQTHHHHCSWHACNCHRPTQHTASHAVGCIGCCWLPWLCLSPTVVCMGCCQLPWLCLSPPASTPVCRTTILKLP